jgi:GMP synthase (glutamine-hydrolysing)
VGNNPNGNEYGTVAVGLSPAATQDALFGGLPDPFLAQVGHTQSVLRLPPEAVHLAYSAREPNQAFRVGERAWGVQFHPEFNVPVVQAYIRARRGALLAERQDPGMLLVTCQPAIYSTQILKRFSRLTLG